MRAMDINMIEAQDRLQGRVDDMAEKKPETPDRSAELALSTVDSQSVSAIMQCLHPDFARIG